MGGSPQPGRARTRDRDVIGDVDAFRVALRARLAEVDDGLGQVEPGTVAQSRLLALAVGIEREIASLPLEAGHADRAEDMTADEWREVVTDAAAVASDADLEAALWVYAGRHSMTLIGRTPGSEDVVLGEAGWVPVSGSVVVMPGILARGGG